jgi:hypothetical protein
MTVTIQDYIDKSIAMLEASIQQDTVELKKAERELLEAASCRDRARSRLSRHEFDLESLRQRTKEEADARIAHRKALGRLRDKARQLCAEQGISMSDG